MAKLLYSATMSLDGFIAAPGGDMSWLTEHLADPDPAAEGLVDRIGAIIAGNGTFGGGDPNEGTDKEGAFGGQYDGPMFVLTHRPPAEPVPGITFVGDLRTAVAEARAAAGDRYVNILGANVARQCIEAGILDEVLVFVAPVLLGDGVRLFDSPGGTRVRLEQLEDEPAHWYRVVYP
ncbi:dihydrofolate reductase family protein [Actinomadura sediminis]|uniref:Dihydrofolate reductase family protein n=1 Tax=Actinomadura sediminis TaxID=1038904 RepID=A0ABW3EQR1_9ACTN